MPLPIFRYQLDPTGVNTNNLVVGELHTLNPTTVRIFTPTYGAFFTESIQVFDANNNYQLVKNTDFKCVELLQEPTLKYGKEICVIILVYKQSVSNNIRINYQVLGGLFENDSSKIAELYEAFVNDSRGVKWEDVFNKPFAYPPSLHNHLVEEVYGFEQIVFALERIRNAIILSDVPIIDDLINGKLLNVYNILIAKLNEVILLASNGTLETDVDILQDAVGVLETEVNVLRSSTNNNVIELRNELLAKLNEVLLMTSNDTLETDVNTLETNVGVLQNDVVNMQATIVAGFDVSKSGASFLSEETGLWTITHSLNTKNIQVSIRLENANPANPDVLLPAFTPSSARPGAFDININYAIEILSSNQITIQFITDYASTTDEVYTKLGAYANVHAYIVGHSL